MGKLFIRLPLNSLSSALSTASQLLQSLPSLHHVCRRFTETDPGVLLTEVDLRGILSDLQYDLLAEILFIHKDILLPTINDGFRVGIFLHTIRILPIRALDIHSKILFVDGPKDLRLWLLWNIRIIFDEVQKGCMTFLILGLEVEGSQRRHTLLAVFLFFGPERFLFILL
jgi:hypothetical protein